MPDASQNSQLPQGWRVTALGDLCEVKRGNPLTRKQTIAGDVPVIAGGQTPAYYHNQANRTGEVITVSGSGAYAGFANFFNNPIFASDCTTLQAKTDNVLMKYVYLAMKSRQTDIYALRLGSAQPHVYAKDIAKIEIPLPPLAEQRRIVAVLDGKMAAVEEARVAALERVEAVRALSLAWLREVFSFGDGELPRGWRWVKLGEVVTAFRGVNFSSGEARPIPAEGYTACLTTSGVQHAPNWDSRRFIPNEQIKNDSQILVSGDIMISTANSKALVGKSCRISDVPYKCVFGAFVTVIRASAQTTPEWISYAIRTDEAKSFFYEESSHTTNISNLKVSTLLDMSIPLPPLPEQKRLVATLNAKMTATQKTLTAAEAELEAITALPSALLRQAFSGAL